MVIDIFQMARLGETSELEILASRSYATQWDTGNQCNESLDCASCIQAIRYNTQTAINCLADLSPKLKTMVNPNARPWEQAMQAVQLENDFMLIARNAMDDANAAAQLSMTTPIRTFEELLADANQKGFYGNAAYKEVMDEAAQEMKSLRTVKMDGGCFVAGTLVHTKDGLKPIEQIKVGDYVLSKSDSDRGEIAYKKVINTFEYENKEVFTVDFAGKDQTGKDRIGTLVVTGNHPFWVKNIGWTRADFLYYPHELELIDGSNCEVFNVSPVILTADEDIGWIQGGYGVDNPDDPYGRIIDLRSRNLIVDYDHNNQITNSEFEPFSENRMKRHVYNLEVDEYHTYFVGELGVWVHNMGCDDPGSFNQKLSQGFIPSSNPIGSG